ncbi:MAG TPA: hypothetical protein EYP10_13450, partial [Armatimonadetes bacterium]|nr:hypothetical protein [Armatimonadota bacterium]
MSLIQSASDNSDACLAIDLGTSSCKALVMDKALQLRGAGSAGFDTAHPAPRHAEQDPNDWWRAMCTAVHEAINEAGDVAIQVIALSSQREGAVLLNEQLQPVHPAIVWIDRRATDEERELVNEFGDEWLSQHIGLVPTAGFTAPILRWLQKHNPDILNVAQRITQPKGYMIARLTGQFAIDHSLAPRFGLFSIREYSYHSELLQWAGIQVERLPQVVEPLKVVGTLTHQAAMEFGLPAGIPVIAGMGDRQCETLGLALSPMEDVMIASGTAANISVLAQSLDMNLHPRIAKGPHLRGLYQLEAGLWACGAALKWLADEMGSIHDSHGDLNEWLEMMARRSRHAESLIVLPFFAGASAPHWDARVLACIIGLSLGHTRADIVRAMIESLAIEIAANVQMYKSAIPSIKRLVHCGGGAMLATFNQAIADATGMELTMPLHHDAAGIGAACLGMAWLLNENPFQLA